MRIDVFTIFPELIDGFCGVSLLGRAQNEGHLELHTHDIREHASDPHRSVDDTPFGGGAGMVMQPAPIFESVGAARKEGMQSPLYLLSPGGRRFDQEVANEWAQLDGVALLCGRYEGVDQRVSDHLCAGEISVADVVLSGGEVAALVVIEAITRLLPGVMGNLDSASEESFAGGLLEYPHYTRPATFLGWEVPEVLRSGNHGAVARWRAAKALERTLSVRPDLILARGGLSAIEVEMLTEIGAVQLLAQNGYA
jgi:tRNA (guanine37-N1)-methyltransferase